MRTIPLLYHYITQTHHTTPAIDTRFFWDASTDLCERESEKAAKSSTQAGAGVLGVRQLRRTSDGCSRATTLDVGSRVSSSSMLDRDTTARAAPKGASTRLRASCLPIHSIVRSRRTSSLSKIYSRAGRGDKSASIERGSQEEAWVSGRVGGLTERLRKPRGRSQVRSEPRRVSMRVSAASLRALDSVVAL